MGDEAQVAPSRLEWPWREPTPAPSRSQSARGSPSGRPGMRSPAQRTPTPSRSQSARGSASGRPGMRSPAQRSPAASPRSSLRGPAGKAKASMRPAAADKGPGLVFAEDAGVAAQKRHYGEPEGMGDFDVHAHAQLGKTGHGLPPSDLWMRWHEPGAMSSTRPRRPPAREPS